jgi:hypothetical protein
MDEAPFFSVILSRGAAVAVPSPAESGRRCDYPESLQETGKNTNPKKSKNTENLFISKMLPKKMPQVLLIHSLLL